MGGKVTGLGITSGHHVYMSTNVSQSMRFPKYLTKQRQQVQLHILIASLLALKKNVMKHIFITFNFNKHFTKGMACTHFEKLSAFREC